MESKSFLELKSINDEWFEDYLLRIRNNPNFNHLPGEVLEQFIHPHFDEPYVIKNYSSIDYHKARFNLKDLTTLEILSIPVLNHKEEFVFSKSKHKSFETMVFSPISGDKESWLNNNTWRVPPVILDIESFKNLKLIDLKEKSKYVLIEGHTRLGHFKSISNFGKLSPKHKVYILQG